MEWSAEGKEMRQMWRPQKLGLGPLEHFAFKYLVHSTHSTYIYTRPQLHFCQNIIRGKA